MEKIPTDFQWKTYISLNPDLEKINTEEESKKHYLKYGKKENRLYKKISDDFDWNIYIQLNPDLYEIKSKEEALTHYLKYGKNENRLYKKENNILPEDFDWKIYLSLNMDLFHIKTQESAIQHYLNYGIKENRQYKITVYTLPNDFDWEMYISLNKELNIKNKPDAVCHYLNYGIKENRVYKIIPYDFDWEVYILLNPDLLEIKNKKEAEIHYLNYGIKENRSYKNILHPKFYNNITNNTKLFPFNKYYIKDINLFKYCIENTNKQYDTLHSNDLFITRKFCSDKKNEYLNYPINNNLLDILQDFILVLDFNNGGGGTTFFINTIVSKYKYNQTFVIARQMDNLLHLNINEDYDLTHKYKEEESIFFLKKYKHKISKIFVNHIDKHTNIFIENINKLGKEIITITHDYSNICSISQPFFHEIEEHYIKPKIKSDIIITQNKINVLPFAKKYKQNMNIIELPDYKYSDKKFIYNNNNIIVVGIIGNIIDKKGRQILDFLINYYSETNVKIIVLGYTIINNFKNYYYYNNINEFNKLLIEHKPNILLELSLWPETYSYTLTLSMLTKLPIIYLKKSFNSVVEERLINYLNAYPFLTINELDTLIKTKSQNYLYTILPVIYYNTYWNNIFLTKRQKIQKIQKNGFKNGITPYFIYFPQFHKINENDLFFYDDFNDIKNLKLYNESNEIKLDTPLLSCLNIKKIDDYDLSNESIIQKQIDLINYYGYSGFALYYYWFSINTVTKKHMIMQKVINNFFNPNINMNNRKIFFIWANENWTDNAAFGISQNNQIMNEYNETNFRQNSKNLIKYFKSENYLKIENKPVFFIYHNYLIQNIDEFYNILNESCILNGFDGIHLVLNSFEEKNQKYPSFYVNFNYKKYESRFYDETDKQIKLNYKEYIDNPYHLKTDSIQTIVTDFNNKPRLFKPNRLHHSTICVNNSEINKIVFMRKIIDNYKTKENALDKILLVNSYNEWGENMAFEPSQQNGYYNLNLLYENLQEN
jgi:hypothetical protein